jgi:hypothetical protein
MCEFCKRSMVRHCKVNGCGWLICFKCDVLYHLKEKRFLKPAQ